MNTLLRLGQLYRLALVTTRECADVTLFLEQNGLSGGLFDLVVVREDVRNILPHIDPLQRTAVLLGVSTRNMLLVSDTDVGLRAGCAAGDGNGRCAQRHSPPRRPARRRHTAATDGRPVALPVT